MRIHNLFPPKLLDDISQDPSQVRQNALLYLIGILYQAGEVSQHLAAEILETEPESLPKLLRNCGFIPDTPPIDTVGGDIHNNGSENIYPNPDPIVGLLAHGSPNLASDAERILEQDIQPQSGWTLK
ncbi:MAG: hypothetical protein VKJ64_00695 [Leptolyngbyaceae bacterium]|nr:hypothetical protein [Leptolyngbyaceae bacterium]